MGREGRTKEGSQRRERREEIGEGREVQEAAVGGEGADEWKRRRKEVLLWREILEMRLWLVVHGSLAGGSHVCTHASVWLLVHRNLAGGCSMRV